MEARGGTHGDVRARGWAPPGLWPRASGRPGMCGSNKPVGEADAAHPGSTLRTADLSLHGSVEVQLSLK